jgi:ABC-type multidrug transport system ATPase subunit
MVKVEAVMKAFGSRVVLRKTSLAVVPGERVVVLGKNGCGKSTLLQIVAGVLEPDAGSVAVSASLGFAPEKPDMPEHLFVREWLDLVASLKRTRWTNADLETLDVRALLGTKIGALSLGQKQRVSLTTAFVGAPPLLVLDEPTNGLDAASRTAVMRRLCEATALVATHDRGLADELATRIVSMD